MAIRDADGFSLHGDALEGIQVRKQVVETTSYVEVHRGVEKTRTAEGATIVEPQPQPPGRDLPRGQVMGPDGVVRSTTDGSAVFAPTDLQMERARSAQRMNLAHEANQAALRTEGLTARAVAQGYYNDGSLVRDSRGRIVEVCGKTVDQQSYLRQHMATDMGVF